MANKKRNKKQNNKQKPNNNKNQKNGSKSRQNSEQSIASSLNSNPSKTSKKDINGVHHKVVDLFGDSDQRHDLSLSEKMSSDNSKPNASHSTNYSPKGLNNLGNTCYLNSVLQIISETHLLFDLLNDRSNDGYIYRVKALVNTNEWSADRPFDEELETTLGQCFPLTQNLISFMREMRATGSRTVSPSKVLNTIRKEWTQFEGWAQQDSHELLRCLLDSLKCKEVKRQRRAIITELKARAEADPNGDDNNLDDDTKARIKSYSTYSSLTSIDTVFGGQLLSTVCCEVCHNTSLKFEPFFDLSLPLTQFTNNYSDSNVLIEKNESKTKNDSNGRQTSDDNCATSGDKKLTPKERRQQRQQKKATKRDLKLQKKAMNTIDIENKENSDNICDKNSENIEQEFKPEVEDWPEVNEWHSNCEEVQKDDKRDDTDLLDHPINDSNPELTDSQEKDRTASEDWTNAWIRDNNERENVVKQSDETIDGLNDFIIEPLLSDFNYKLVVCSDITDWDVGERPSPVQNEDEDDISTYIDMLYDNKDNKEDNEDVGWNDWREEGWPITNEPPYFGPELPPGYGHIEAVDEECDEYKAQEIEFQSLDYESELLMSNISDGQKLEIKHSNTDPSNTSVDFDPNSETIKQIISLCSETISDNSVGKLPKFDLLHLLSNFTALEWLSGNNKYFCEMCTKTKGSDKDKQFTNASKRALIALPPPVLTLHLKRFEADGYRRSISLKKISTFVSFPLTFDLSPFVSKMYNYLQPITGQTPVSALIYGLYGVVQHSGTLRSGHYTAYIKFRPNNRNQNKRFANLEPFLPKVENVLKMIEYEFFATNPQTSSATNGFSSDESHTNGTTSAECSQCEVHEEYSCSASDSGKWFHISDSSVTSSSLSAVLKSNAYILFYERIA